MSLPHSADAIRLAVVEDNLSFRRGRRAIFDLTPSIECVGMYATGEKALREMARVAPDVVLMDLNLPGMSDRGAGSNRARQTHQGSRRPTGPQRHDRSNLSARRTVCPPNEGQNGPFMAPPAGICPAK
jgi:CheY-like chemotaxis protein